MPLRLSPSSKPLSAISSPFAYLTSVPHRAPTAPAMRTAPSFINDNTVKSAIAEEGNILMSVAHKHLVRIDWVSSEDGSHMLTLGVGSKVGTRRVVC